MCVSSYADFFGEAESNRSSSRRASNCRMVSLYCRELFPQRGPTPRACSRRATSGCSSKSEETPMTTNTQILLDHRPTDKVSPANFRIVETPVPAPGPGEVLVRHTFLSLDPYMRGRLSDAKSYAKPQEVGAVMGGGTVGIVEASNNPRFKAGDAVVGMGGWQRYFVERRRAPFGWSTRNQSRSRPISARSGCPASPRGTASTRSSRRSRAKQCSSRRRPARSARWSASSPSIAGARAVGIAGGPEKCAYAVERARLRRLRRPQVVAFRRGAEGGAAERCRRIVRERRRRTIPAGAAAAQRFFPRRRVRPDRVL